MEPTVLLRGEEISRIVERLVAQIMEKHLECEHIMLVGIQRRGVDLAKRLQRVFEERLRRRMQLGTLDINFYRDDWTTLHGIPHIGQSNIPQNIDDATIVLVDDVLFTGRTVRAALEALLDYGRPRSVELLVLIDRGHRELPIHANYVGRNVNTRRTEQVNVLLAERDGQDLVTLS